MRIRKIFALMIVVCVCLNRFPLTAQQLQSENIPTEIADALDNVSFAQDYTVNGSMNPFYLRGDFDGDGKPDYAVWIKSRKKGEVGIAIWLSSAKKFTIIGAGIPFRVAGAQTSDLNFLDAWQVYRKQPVERGVGEGPPPRLIGEAILLAKSESASGLLYWNGKSFVWYQQGD